MDKNIFDLSDIKQNYKEDIKLEKVKNGHQKQLNTYP